MSHNTSAIEFIEKTEREREREIEKRKFNSKDFLHTESQCKGVGLKC